MQQQRTVRDRILLYFSGRALCVVITSADWPVSFPAPFKVTQVGHAARKLLWSVGGILFTPIVLSAIFSALYCTIWDDNTVVAAEVAAFLWINLKAFKIHLFLCNVFLAPEMFLPV